MEQIMLSKVAAPLILSQALIQPTLPHVVSSVINQIVNSSVLSVCQYFTAAKNVRNNIGKATNQCARYSLISATHYLDTDNKV